MEPVVGFEPTTDGLQNRCSTTELNWRTNRRMVCVPRSPDKDYFRAASEIVAAEVSRRNQFAILVE